MEHRTPGVKVFSGRFTTDGTSAPTVLRGDGFSVGAPSTGVFTVTFDQQFTSYLDYDAHLDEAAAGSGRAIVTAVDPVAGTMVIEVQDSIGSPANLTGPIVGFRVEFVGLLP